MTKLQAEQFVTLLNNAGIKPSLGSVYDDAALDSGLYLQQGEGDYLAGHAWGKWNVYRRSAAPNGFATELVMANS
jgi:hypothetical protein